MQPSDLLINLLLLNKLTSIIVLQIFVGRLSGQMDRLVYLRLCLVGKPENLFLGLQIVDIVVVVLQGEIFLLDDLSNVILVQGVQCLVEISESIVIQDGLNANFSNIVGQVWIYVFVAAEEALKLILQILSVSVSLGKVYDHLLR